MFYLQAVPVPQFVADYIERTNVEVVEWIWFSRNQLWHIHKYYSSICQDRMGNSQKLLTLKTGASVNIGTMHLQKRYCLIQQPTLSVMCVAVQQ